MNGQAASSNVALNARATRSVPSDTNDSRKSSSEAVDNWDGVQVRSTAEFTFQLELRGEVDDLTDIPWEFRRLPPERDEDLPDDLLRLGVIYADGSSWRNLDSPGRPTMDERPSGPVVVMHRGGGDRGSWTMCQWLWPLPPDGPLTIVAEWPKYGVSESHAVVDGGKIRAAAEQAENLWPDQDGAPEL